MLYDTVITKLEMSDGYKALDNLGLRTISKNLGIRGRFDISANDMLDLLAGMISTLGAEDSDNYLTAWVWEGVVHFKLMWYLRFLGDDVLMARQKITVPVSLVERALNGEKITHVDFRKPPLAKLDFSRAGDAIKQIQADKHLRRAFVKIIKASRWRGKDVRFYREGGRYDFFYRNAGIGEKCGGVCLEQLQMHTRSGIYPYWRYGVHT